MKRFCTIAVAILLVVLQVSCSLAENGIEMDFSPTTEKEITFNGLPWGSSRETFLETVYYLCSGSKVNIHPGDIDWSASSQNIYAQIYYLLHTGDQNDYENPSSFTEKSAPSLFSVYSVEMKFDDVKDMFNGSLFPRLYGITGDFEVTIVLMGITFDNPITIAGHGVNAIIGVFYSSPIDEQYHLFLAGYNFIIDDGDHDHEMEEDLQHKLSVLYGEAHAALNEDYDYIWIGKNNGAVYLDDSEELISVFYGDLSVSEKLQEIESELQRKTDETLDYTGL